MNSGDLALMIPIVVPTVTMLVIGGTIALITYFRFRRRREVQETIRIAIEKGQELPTEFLETISSPKSRPKKDQDLRRGVVLTAVGLGIGAFGVLVGEDDAVGPLMGIGSIPFLIGLALTALWILRTRHNK
ncbi:MAG: DUF6249 domain-containing protein [Gammaproteobacteria bacterium]|nr:DUF6249 domain-containing protein [Gammaproteobacteria bacterium]MXW46462.1 hypothetical protein [Gammaproteobacteria bacterium]MYD02133.1 hypothetical protein [Gammaproteobacteria bacterium]MYI24598.1 hypothetical protein [Gammaproteobacteria bacterium]